MEKIDKTLVIAIKNKLIASEIMDMFRSDDRILPVMLMAENKLIYECLRLRPDVIFFEDGFTQMSSNIVIAALKSLDELKFIKILLLIQKMKTTDEVFPDVDDLIEMKDFNKTTFLKKVLNLLNIPEGSVKTYTNKRKYPRTNVRIPALYSYRSQRIDSQSRMGRGLIRDISMGGMRLEYGFFDQDATIYNAARINIYTNIPPLLHFHSDSKVVRVKQHECGVMFLNISDEDKMKINSIISV